MIGKEIAKNELDKYDGKIVYVTFAFDSISYWGCTEEEYEKFIDELREEYPDGLFKFIFGEYHTILNMYKMVDGSLERVDDLGEGGYRLALQHNLIDKIYEWIEGE